MIERSLDQKLATTIEAQISALQTEVEKANILMETLENAVRSPSGIVDPDLQHAKNVLRELNRIIPQIHSQWVAIQKARAAAEKDSSPEQKEKIKKIRKMIRKFAVVVRATKSIMHKITHSLFANEKHIDLASGQLKEFKDEVNPDDIGFFNDTTDSLNKDIEDISAQYKILKNETNHISRIELAKKVSIYMTYGTAATKASVEAVLAVFMETLTKYTHLLGEIFSPISSFFTALIQSLNFGYRVIQYRVMHNQLKDPEIIEEHRRELEQAKAELRKSILFRFMATVLSGVSILAFFGVIFTPLGAGFVAAAAFMVWLDDGLSPYLRAKEAVDKFKKNNPGELTLDERLEFEAREERLQLKKSAAFWTGAPILGLVLVAFAPIPIAGPILSMVGSGIIGVALARNTLVTVKKLYIERQMKKRREKRGHIEEEGYELQELHLDKSPSRRNSHSFIITHSPQASPAGKTVADTTAHLAEDKPPAVLKRSASGILFTPAVVNSPLEPKSENKLKRSNSMPSLKNKK